MNRTNCVVATAALAAACLLVRPAAADPSVRRTEQELNLNVFRNPSIGVEYRRGWLAGHVGMYPTIISKDETGDNETTWFAKVGVTAFFLGTSLYGQRESEVYVSTSYMRGLNHGRGNGALVDVGYRWMVWGGLNVRLGVAALLEPGHRTKINPTPGIGWSTSL
jgi:hypothetical protein